MKLKMREIILVVLVVLLSGVRAEGAPDQDPKAKSVTASQTQSEETLFNTLNETLEENRKIRLGIKELQQALQKKTIESEDLKKELRNLEGLALERNRELLTQTKDLEKKLAETDRARADFEKEREDFLDKKEKLEALTRKTEEENARLKKLLANSVLDEEREAILKAAQENGQVAKRAEERLAKLNYDNQKFRNELVAAHYEMGANLFQLKRYQEAHAAYEKVVELDSTHAWAYHNLAVLDDYYLDDPGAAYSNYQKYLNYKPLDEEAGAVRRRVLDMNMLQKVAPQSPLKADFERIQQEGKNAKV